MPARPARPSPSTSRGDTTDENNETFTLTLSAPVGATLSDAAATAYIVDDEGSIVQPPKTFLSVNDFSLTEGDSGTTNATFTVTRSGDTSGTSTVKYKTTEGTAKAAEGDYAALPLTTLSFAPGEATKTVTVDVTGDKLPEGDEYFKLTLSSSTGAVLADSSGTATLLNDDGAAYLAVDNVSVTEGDSGVANATFTVTRSGNTAGSSTVTVKTSGGTATAGADYTSITQTLTFAPGETTKSVSVDLAGDTAVERNETFNLALSAPVGATVSDVSGLATIVNDD